MQMAQPTTSPLGIVLLIAAIYLVVTSPKKMQTLGRMGIAFVGTVVLIMVLGAILRRGDPQALGAIAGLVGLLVAVIAGWWHTRSLKRGTPESRN
jgi:succinate-acetate transporter protein